MLIKLYQHIFSIFKTNVRDKILIGLNVLCDLSVTVSQ